MYMHVLVTPFILYRDLCFCDVKMFSSTLWRMEASKAVFAIVSKES